MWLSQKQSISQNPGSPPYLRNFRKWTMAGNLCVMKAPCENTQMPSHLVVKDGKLSLWGVWGTQVWGGGWNFLVVDIRILDMENPKAYTHTHPYNLKMNSALQDTKSVYKKKCIPIYGPPSRAVDPTSDGSKILKGKKHLDWTCTDLITSSLVSWMMSADLEPAHSLWPPPFVPPYSVKEQAMLSLGES